MNAVKTMMISMGASAAVFGIAAIARKARERRMEKELDIDAEFDKAYRDLSKKIDEDMKNFRVELFRVPLEESEQGDLFRAFKEEA